MYLGNNIIVSHLGTKKGKINYLESDFVDAVDLACLMHQKASVSSLLKSILKYCFKGSNLVQPI